MKQVIVELEDGIYESLEAIALETMNRSLADWISRMLTQLVLTAVSDPDSLYKAMGPEMQQFAKEFNERIRKPEDTD